MGINKGSPYKAPKGEGPAGPSVKRGTPPSKGGVRYGDPGTGQKHYN